MVDVCIIGAGVSGLALAHQLEQAGFEVVLLESSDRVGGVVQTVSKDGFLLELGPNSSLSRPPFLDFLATIGLRSELVYPEATARNRYLAIPVDKSFPTRELAPVPRSLSGFLRTPILSARGKLRLLREPFIKAARMDDESVYSFMSRRFGVEFTENVVASLLGGIWAADIRTLSCRSALPSLWKQESNGGSIIAGSLRKQLGKSYPRGYQRPSICSFYRGMNTLPETLATKLRPGSLGLGTTVTSIKKETYGIRVCYNVAQNSAVERTKSEDILAASVVCTTPAKHAASLLADINPALSRSAEKITYAPLGVLHVGIRSDCISHPLDGFGFLVPPRFQNTLLGVIFSSSLFRCRAPEGHHLLTCFAGGAGKPARSDVRDVKVQLAILEELNELLGLKGEPKILSAQYYPTTIPNYAVGHHVIQNQLVQFQKECPEIRFLANWDRGISVPDRIESALGLANEMIQNEIAVGKSGQRLRANG